MRLLVRNDHDALLSINVDLFNLSARIRNKMVFSPINTVKILYSRFFNPFYCYDFYWLRL